ncbi:MAG: PIN domain-containing protein [Prevotella sp.]|nr:PIN domain-containing protein [Prevotella sp.]
MNQYIVLDTNCLLQSISQRSKYYTVWESFILGKYTLCVSNEILEEYEEILSSHMLSRTVKSSFRNK